LALFDVLIDVRPIPKIGLDPAGGTVLKMRLVILKTGKSELPPISLNLDGFEGIASGHREANVCPYGKGRSCDFLFRVELHSGIKCHVATL